MASWRFSSRWLSFSLTLATLLMLGIWAYWLRLEASHARMLTTEEARAEREAVRLSNGLTEQMSAVLRGIDFAAKDLRIRYGGDARGFERMAHLAASAFPPNALLNVAITDARGRVSYSNLGGIGTDISDREHFRVHADHPGSDRLFISAPILSRVSHRWAIQFSRPLFRQGKFDGVLILSMSPEYLSRTLESLGLESNDSAGLVRWDGSYLARSSRIGDLVGKSVKADRPYLRPDAPLAGVFRDEATHEPVRRIFAWHRLPEFPQLSVFVGLSEADALAPVKREIAESRRHNLLGTLLVVVFAGGIVFLLFRIERQRRALTESEVLYRNLFETNTAIKLLLDAESGVIRAANAAACAFYGYPREVLEGMPISKINCLPPEEIQREVELAKRESRLHFFFPHRLANGEIRQVEVYSGPLEIGGRAMLYSIVHDITGRRELEKKLEASEERYRTIFEVIPDGLILVDGRGEIVFWNAAALNILGVDAEGLKARLVRLRYRDGQPVPAEQYPTRRAAREADTRGLYAIEEDGGERRWIAVDSRRLPQGDDAAPAGAVVSFSDVTRLVALEESLLISQSVFESAGEGIMVTDAGNRFLRINPAFTRITGYTMDDLRGHRPAILSSGQHDIAFFQAMYGALNERGHWEGDITNRRKDGGLYVQRLKITVVRNPQGGLLRYVAMISDVTQQKRQERDIWQQAYYDGLTSLPNRALLRDRLGQALARAQRHDAHAGLLFIDLDRFKPVNDQYGHEAGDALLKQVAERIVGMTREEDTVARIGGDEFVVLLPAVRGAEDCREVAAKVLDALNRPFPLAEADVEISASIGIAISPEDGETAETLLKQADIAMYQAKAAGRSTIYHDGTLLAED